MITYKDVVEQAKVYTDIQAHMMRLFDLTVKLPREKVVVELGVRSGNSTTSLLAAVNDSGGHVYSIDLLPPREPVATYAVAEPNWTFIMGNDMDIVRTWDKPIDHLFIDTTHMFEQTLSELRAWGKYVRVGGIITLHDLYGEGTFGGQLTEVMQAINKYMEENPQRFVFTAFPDSYGLGLLEKVPLNEFE